MPPGPDHGQVAPALKDAAEAITDYEGLRRTVLVVDDCEENRALLRDALAPPLEVIARLSELSERGRLQELSQVLVALEAEEPRFGPWLREARALADGFRLHELSAMLAAPGGDAAR